MDDRLSVLVRPMKIADIEQVRTIDKLSFPIAWSERTYRHEVLNNQRSTMLVVQKPNARPIMETNGRRADNSGWFNRLFNTPLPETPAVPLMAYSGFWKIADEAHISTIAVHPDWRGNKLGEMLIWIMVREAIEQKAEMVTLEVRISNEVAINLYRKYGFEVTGRRKGYYRDNNEDAHIMTVTPLDAAYRNRLARYGHKLAEQLDIVVRSLPATTL